MILFDSGLASVSPRSPAAARRRAASNSSTDASLRLPAQRTLSRFLAEAQKAVRLRGQVSVLLTTDPEIRRLNRLFRSIDRSTDVLSFPAPSFPEAAEEIAGDLAISVPAARRQAVEHEHSLLIEIKILILHGLLHLAGYDHHADSGQMERRERLLRARLNLPHGLIERAAGDSAPLPAARKRRSRAAGNKTAKGRAS
ncbi:MAG TPA: rRNA maturation RNase YbeY [Terracidiphilus sp.]